MFERRTSPAVNKTGDYWSHLRSYAVRNFHRGHSAKSPQGPRSKLADIQETQHKNFAAVHSFFVSCQVSYHPLFFPFLSLTWRHKKQYKSMWHFQFFGLEIKSMSSSKISLSQILCVLYTSKIGSAITQLKTGTEWGGSRIMRLLSSHSQWWQSYNNTVV